MGEEEELDRRIDPVFMSPDHDQEKHRDQHQFPEEIEEKQIQSGEDTDDSGQRPQQIEMEKPHPLPNLRPRNGHTDHPQKKRQDDHQETQAIEREDETDSQRGHPDVTELEQPGGMSGNSRQVPGLSPDSNRQRQIRPQRHQRNPAGRHARPAGHHPGRQSPHERKQNEPQNRHEATTIPRINATPRAIPATYHRTRPDCVKTRRRCPIPFNQAIPV